MKELSKEEQLELARIIKEKTGCQACCVITTDHKFISPVIPSSGILPVNVNVFFVDVEPGFRMQYLQIAIQNVVLNPIQMEGIKPPPADDGSVPSPYLDNLNSPS